MLFGVLHSVTAGADPRRGLGCALGRAHRLGYNALALVEFGAVVAVGAWCGRHARHFGAPGVVVAAKDIALLAGAALMLAGLRSYRLGPFLGWAQLRGEEDAAQPLVVDGLHKRLRHPLYTAALLLLWGAVGSELSLATAIWGSLYLVLGSCLEERRLIARYGHA